MRLYVHHGDIREGFMEGVALELGQNDSRSQMGKRKEFQTESSMYGTSMESQLGN